MNERKKINDIIFIFAKKFIKILNVGECTVHWFK
jgi:hypothetical protein